jgi:hypothetical protein
LRLGDGRSKVGGAAKTVSESTATLQTPSAVLFARVAFNFGSQQQACYPTASKRMHTHLRDAVLLYSSYTQLNLVEFSPVNFVLSRINALLSIHGGVEKK